MSENGSLMNLGDLTKPATVLVERVCDAIGAIALPWQIDRTAKAEKQATIIRAEGEAVAAKIKAKTQIEIGQLEERAIERLISIERTKQETIESIVRSALDELHEDAKPEDIEEDWLLHFFEKCRITTDEEMRSLWAKILAGEANEEGSFSKRTINVVSTLTKDEAKLFTKVASLTWMYGKIPLIFVGDLNDHFYKEKQLTYGKFAQLEEIGLLQIERVISHTIRVNEKKTILDYFRRQFLLEFESETGNKLTLGPINFTETGRQLFHISGAEPLDKYPDYMSPYFHKYGISLMDISAFKERQ